MKMGFGEVFRVVSGVQERSDRSFLADTLIGNPAVYHHEGKSDHE